MLIAFLMAEMGLKAESLLEHGPKGLNRNANGPLQLNGIKSALPHTPIQSLSSCVCKSANSCFV